MIFYKVHFYTDGGGSKGFEFFTNKRDAEKSATKYQQENPDEGECEIEKIEVTPTKLGILKALNRYAGHPDNG